MNALIITEMTAVRMNVIADRTQNLLAAGAKAMMVENLKEKLRNGIAHFIFIKKNGEVREAWGLQRAWLRSMSMAEDAAERHSRRQLILTLRKARGVHCVGNPLSRSSKVGNYGRVYSFDFALGTDGGVLVGLPPPHGTA